MLLLHKPLSNDIAKVLEVDKNQRGHLVCAPRKEKEPPGISYLYLMLESQINAKQTSSSEWMGVITCSLTWLLPGQEVTFICFQLCEMSVKVLGASSPMPAMAVVMGHAVCHMAVLGLPLSLWQ